MTSKDAALYGIKRQKRMHGEKEISTSSGLSFASQLGSLMKTNTRDPGHARATARPPKDDIFKAHHRNAAASKKARKLADSQQPFGQQHTVDGEGLDRTTWERSKRKMEEKARLYAAMKRGDVEDTDDKYTVDFDRKWAELDEDDEDLSDQESEDEHDQEMIEYIDEFGRTIKTTRAKAAREMRRLDREAQWQSDRGTARPAAPSNVIYGDTIQHEAFDPDAPIVAQMEQLAKKRDRSLTPPPDSHFDANREIRQKGTGFFQFSEDNEERKRQMEELEAERVLTEEKRRAREKEQRLRDEVLERDREFREDDNAARLKRKADDFLNDLADKLDGFPKVDEPMDAMQRIEAALANEIADE